MLFQHGPGREGEKKQKGEKRREKRRGKTCLCSYKPQVQTGILREGDRGPPREGGGGRRSLQIPTIPHHELKKKGKETEKVYTPWRLVRGKREKFEGFPHLSNISKKGIKRKPGLISVPKTGKGKKKKGEELRTYLYSCSARQAQRGGKDEATEKKKETHLLDAF